MTQVVPTAKVPTWCPSCPNFLTFASIRQATANININLSKLVMVYDIGCFGNMADFLRSYGIHTLHGRSIAVAMGIKLANPDLLVCVAGGDGGIYGEGLNHLIAAARANSPIKIIVANNQLYSLTTGQTSPTSPKGSKTKSTPLGTQNEPIDATKLLEAVNPQIFTRSVEAKNISALQIAIKEAFAHPGFALIDITQECVVFGKQLHS